MFLKVGNFYGTSNLRVFITLHLCQDLILENFYFLLNWWGKKCIVAALLSISLITYQIEHLLKCLLAIFCLFLKYLSISIYIYVLCLLFEGCLPFCGIIYSYYHSFLLYAHIFSPIHCLSFNFDSFLKILLISIVKCLPYIYDSVFWHLCL